jgi:hypothetical protein
MILLEVEYKSLVNIDQYDIYKYYCDFGVFTMQVQQPIYLSTV